MFSTDQIKENKLTLEQGFSICKFHILHEFELFWLNFISKICEVGRIREKNEFALIFILIVILDATPSLHLSYQVVQEYISLHYIPKLFLMQQSFRASLTSPLTHPL